MNTILDKEESRSVEAAQVARVQETQIIANMRQEIGEQHYEEAVRQLPLLAQAIDTIFRPFVQQLAALQAKSGTPLPGMIRIYLAQLSEQCDGALPQLRAGIESYTSLSMRHMRWIDGSIDRVVRGEHVAQIRAQLRSHDGRLSLMENQKTTIEQYITDSGWPAAQPESGSHLTPPRSLADEVTVVS